MGNTRGTSYVNSNARQFSGSAAAAITVMSNANLNDMLSAPRERTTMNCREVEELWGQCTSVASLPSRPGIALVPKSAIVRSEI